MKKEKNTILVVEDDLVLSYAIKTSLESSNYFVITVRNSDDAIKELDANKDISAIWLDHYLLGGSTGIDIVTHVKKSGSKYRSLPIFLVSNTASNDKVSSYIRLGVTKYFVKTDSTLGKITEDITRYLSKHS